MLYEIFGIGPGPKLWKEFERRKNTHTLIEWKRKIEEAFPR
jgi:hypothetical protein